MSLGNCIIKIMYDSTYIRMTKSQTMTTTNAGKDGK